MIDFVKKGKEIYLEGVERAENDGLIIRGKGHYDGFSHIDGALSPSNTRRLPPQVFALLAHVSSNAKVLDVGAGSGSAAWELHNERPDLGIHTLGLSPINPYLGFSGSNAGVSDRTKRVARPFSGELFGTDAPYADLLGDQPSEGTGFSFERVAKPFIERQYVMSLMNMIFDTRYAILYEQFGPVFHTYADQVRAKLHKLLDATDEESAIVLTGLTGHSSGAFLELLSEHLPSKWAMAGKRYPQNGVQVAVGPEHPLHSSLSRFKEAPLLKEDQFVSALDWHSQ